MNSEIIVYLDTIRAHLMRCRLPVPVGISVTPWKGCIGVQLAAVDLAELAADLLSWAGTLDGSAVELVRTSDGLRVLITVVGRLEAGHVVHVWGAVRYVRAVFPDLPVSVEQDVSVRVLRGWAKGQGVAA